MCGTRDQITRHQKRQRSQECSLDESRPPKRLKPSIRLHSAEFYDSLSRVRLTRRALKEHDRRTIQISHSQQPAPACQLVDRKDKHLQRFARHGGPRLHDLRRLPPPTDSIVTLTMSTSSAKKQNPSARPAKKNDSSSKRSSAYDNNFEQLLVDHGIYMNSRKSKPKDTDGLRRRLLRSRPSLSPSRFSENAFEDFQRKNEDLIDEGEVMRDVLPVISGDASIPSKQNLLFSKLDSIANSTIVDAKPDLYDGAGLETIDKCVRDDLAHSIIPTKHRAAPVAPNFFFEAKGPEGGGGVAKRQACHDGALGARAMSGLQSYKQDEHIYDGNAYTITSTYHAETGTLNMYTTHLTHSTDDNPEYHMTQIHGSALSADSDNFRRGANAFRNAREWAQERRDGLISAANLRSRSITAKPSAGACDRDGLPRNVYEGAEHVARPDRTAPGSSDLSHSSKSTVVSATEELETAPGEPTLGTRSKSIALDKRRKLASQKAVCKSLRPNHSKSTKIRPSNRKVRAAAARRDRGCG